MVTNETVVVDQPQQENISRSIGKHKRAQDVVGLACHEPSALTHAETKKRRALAPITNKQDWFAANSSKAVSNTFQKKPVVKATTSLVSIALENLDFSFIYHLGRHFH